MSAHIETRVGASTERLERMLEHQASEQRRQFAHLEALIHSSIEGVNAKIESIRWFIGVALGVAAILVAGLNLALGPYLSRPAASSARLSAPAAPPPASKP